MYRFDDDNIGFDSVGANALQLFPMGNPTFTTSDFVQGVGALLVSAAGPDALTSTDSAFDSPPGSSLTYGGWFRLTYDSAADALGKGLGPGYSLIRNGQNAAGCVINDGVYTASTASPGSWPLDEWVHIVCSFDNAADLIATYVGGQQAQTTPKTDIDDDANQAFTVPYRNMGSPYTGLIDEVFFADRAIDADAVLRIHACGIDGQRCTCNPSAPTEYLDCGAGEPACNILPPCNQQAP